MLTKIDIKNLVAEFKKTFVTKEDIKKVEARINNKIDNVLITLAQDIGDVMVEVKKTKIEVRGNRIVLGDHENRLQKLEMNPRAL